MKTLLILLDGLRPEGIEGLAFTEKLKARSTYCMRGRTVMPSATLPCHMSLFHSVTPERHGTTTNTYAPQVRPVSGLCEQLKLAKKTCAFFYDWEELRDLTRPGSLMETHCMSGEKMGCENTKDRNCRLFTDRVREGADADFTFLYMGWPDHVGHSHGFLSGEYMRAVENCWGSVEQVMSCLGDDYSVIITADHGGHGLHHGTDMDEDMTIPVFFTGSAFECGKELESCSIMDIAPTIIKLHGAEAAPEWVGKSII